MPNTLPQRWRVRPATEADRGFLGTLAARLTIGTAPWLNEQTMEATMRRFLLEDLARMSDTTTLLIAEAPDGTPAGAASIGLGTHFTGAPQAYLGELAVSAAYEGQGVGSALLAAAEAWAREHGAPTVVLDTGASNAHARRFYARHGYQEESVKLSKTL